jgi:RNA polymerase sigma factor (sigma-70 family)
LRSCWNNGFFNTLRIVSGSPDLSEARMGEEDVAARCAIATLAANTREAWETFARLASGAAWKASLHAGPRRALAEDLFGCIMAGLHADRLQLAERLTASRLPTAAAFLDREIDRHVGQWVFALVRAEAADAAEALVRAFHGDLRRWVQHAVSPEARGQLDDLAQEVYAALLEHNGRRLRAYNGDGEFRSFLRTMVINLVADLGRRERGRQRPRAAFARLTELQQQAYLLVFERRLSAAEATRRLARPDAAEAVAAVLALGDLGTTHSGRRPHLVALDGGEQSLDIADDRDTPEDVLLAHEEMVERTAREVALLAALRGMPAQTREILEQRFLHGRKPREIAVATGADVKEVYRTLERALVQLKRDLGAPS